MVGEERWSIGKCYNIQFLRYKSVHIFFTKHLNYLKTFFDNFFFSNGVLGNPYSYRNYRRTSLFYDLIKAI